MDGHSLIYGIARTDPEARHALDALITIDASRLLFLPGNCFCRTRFKTAAALDAGFIVHFKLEKGGTILGRAAFIPDMGLILVPEITQGREDRIRSGLTQTA